MKIKIYAVFSVLLIMLLTISVSANQNYSKEEYIVTIEVREIPSIERSSTKIGSKTYTYSNKSGEVLWKYTVYGKFSYNGKNATCIQVTDEYNFVASDWSLKSHSTKVSGNQAVGNISAKQTVLGQIVNTVSDQVVLSCSSDGNLY